MAVPVPDYPAKGKAYRRVVDSYLYPNKNLKALSILPKLGPFIIGLALLSMAAMELMTISTEHGLMFN
ncbi:hypothetical protein OLMES_1594 [Oleiphilus messinensis]|uniref:Uncharacterized protein n=1 Tax=Oleiphilus messinensis TaxID=141451 RepID=A0A1Y0I638_9GAMM|nr:hypothetical protein [Oleiphilus messinensis]ARU55669.1 hypothetical protein OLMES_1594 [Oleiphilus messinensis]